MPPASYWNTAPCPQCIYMSSGLSVPALALGVPTMPVGTHCQVSNNCARHQQATDRQTVQYCVCKHNQELALHTSGFERTQCEAPCDKMCMMCL